MYSPRTFAGVLESTDLYACFLSDDGWCVCVYSPRAFARIHIGIHSIPVCCLFLQVSASAGPRTPSALANLVTVLLVFLYLKGNKA